MAEDEHRITDAMLTAAIVEKLGLDKASADVQIKEFRVSEGSNKGDNFACVMKAVSVDAVVNGEDRTFEFMAKCVPMQPMRAAWIVQSKIFTKEVLAYTHILPAVRKCLPEGIELGVPLCFYGDDEVMLMENLKTTGYKLVNKRVGLDMTHIKLLLDQLAMLHSTSYHWIQTYPGGLDKARKNFELFFHDDGWISHGNDEMRIQFEVMMTKMFEGSTAIVKKFAPDRPHLGEWMEKFTVRLIPTLTEVSRVKPDQFCTLLHGDCWNNNFMFLYDGEGNLKTMMMLDYQLMRYGSVVHDLSYFLCSSTSPEMRVDHLDDMLDHYHQRLTSHLANHGYPASLYPKESFVKDFNDCFAFGYITGTFIAQVILSEKAVESGGAMDMDDIKTEAEMNKKIETYDKLLLEEASDNVPLQQRLVRMAEEAIHRNL